MQRYLRGLIPVVRNVVKVEFDNRPKVVSHESGVSIGHKPVRVCDQGSSA